MWIRLAVELGSFAIARATAQGITMRATTAVAKAMRAAANPIHSAYNAIAIGANGITKTGTTKSAQIRLLARPSWLLVNRWYWACPTMTTTSRAGGSTS